jgi:hypothetical protein
VDNYLITQWSFKNTLLSVKELNGKLGMSDKGVPTTKESLNWSVPCSVLYPRPPTQVDFDLGHKVVVSCSSF